MKSDTWLVERVSTSLQGVTFDIPLFVCLRFRLKHQHEREEFMEFTALENANEQPQYAFSIKQQEFVCHNSLTT